MPPPELPPELIARFRGLAQARLDRIEALWLELTAGAGQEAAAELMRELHTLKGDSRAVGQADVSVLCHKLEELLLFAEACGWVVGEDIDLLLVTALQFIGMLLKRKPGQELGGIDLEGFTQQIDALLQQDHPRSTRQSGDKRPTSRRSADRVEWLAPATRERLAVAGTSVFLEHLRANGQAATRLLAIWRGLAAELRELDAVALGPRLGRHAAASQELARALGKQLELTFEFGDLRADPGLVEALDVVVMHALRNAVDHGLEKPGERALRGKPPAGRVRVSATRENGMLRVRVEDDGRGVDLDAVSRRAIKDGLLSAAQAARADATELLPLVFGAGFSTRDGADAVSGRGVGMDALRTAVVRAGGSVDLVNRPGRGLSVEVGVEAATAWTDVHTLSLRREGLQPLTLAVAATWVLEAATDARGGIDVCQALDLGASSNPPPTSFVLGSGSCELTLLAHALGADAQAERPCRTADDYPLEVVLLAVQSCLLIRPQVMGWSTVTSHADAGASA